MMPNAPTITATALRDRLAAGDGPACPNSRQAGEKLLALGSTVSRAAAAV